VPVEVVGNVTWQRRNVLGVKASIVDGAGTLLAQAEGSFVSRGRLDAVDDRRNPNAR
jgi:hypothetical protein